MTQISKLLKMIEEVDLNDNKGLDDIEREVWYYLVRPPEERAMRKGYVWKPCPPKYTRSRDALKKIRPERWMFSMHGYIPTDEIHVSFIALNMTDSKNDILTPHLPSEELAELHAILQAIEYERGTK